VGLPVRADTASRDPVARNLFRVVASRSLELVPSRSLS
jgi:hypothetical protein